MSHKSPKAKSTEAVALQLRKRINKQHRNNLNQNFKTLNFLSKNAAIETQRINQLTLEKPRETVEAKATISITNDSTQRSMPIY